MPAKRKFAKDRLDPETECHIFDSVFTTGYDFGDELSLIGLSEPPRALKSAELVADYIPKLIETAREAWDRIGALWLDRHWSQQRYPLPFHDLWAAQMFGHPKGTIHG